MLHIFPADRPRPLEESVYATAAVLSASPKTDRPRLTSNYSLHRRHVSVVQWGNSIILAANEVREGGGGGQLVCSFLHLEEWIVLAAAVFARECSRDRFAALLPSSVTAAANTKWTP